eukprot:c20662_g1_i1 orf=541-741(+)
MDVRVAENLVFAVEAVENLDSAEKVSEHLNDVPESLECNVLGKPCLKRHRKPSPFGVRVAGSLTWF